MSTLLLRGAGYTACRLGKWYYEGEGRDCFSRLKGNRELESPHIVGNKSGITALEAKFSGNMVLMLCHVASMENSSLIVSACLDRMADSAAPD